MAIASASHRCPLALGITLALGAVNAGAISISVNDGGDSATPTGCTLRNAITAVDTAAFALSDPCSSTSSGSFGSSDTIVFDAALANTSIALQHGQLDIIVPVTITGSGQSLDAHGASRIFHVSGTLNASDLTLRNGHSDVNTDGSAILITGAGSAVTLTNSTVTGGSGGPSISALGNNLSAPALSLVNSTVTANTSNRHAAGLSIEYGAATLTNSTVSGNSVTCTSNLCAGGLYAVISTVQMSGSTVSGNTASGSTFEYVAGGAYFWYSSVSLVNSTIAGNSASGNRFISGALQESHPTGASGGLTLTNVTVSANTAMVTMYSNYASPFVTGGILIGAGGAGTLTAANSIIAANRTADADPYRADLYWRGAASFTLAYSVLGSGLNVDPFNNASKHNRFSDTPGLTSLHDNGGPTQTMALLSGSLAVDNGSNALAVDSASQPLQYDQTGSARIEFGVVDIGAFELRDHIFNNGFD